MPSTTVVATSKTELKLKPAVKTKLLKELKAYEVLADQRKAIELAIKKHKGNIEEIQEETGETSLAIDGFKVTLVAPIRHVLDKKKLIALGVSADIIEEATVEVSGKPYIKVTVPGAKDEGDDE